MGTSTSVLAGTVTPHDSFCARHVAGIAVDWDRRVSHQPSPAQPSPTNRPTQSACMRTVSFMQTRVTWGTTE